MELAGGRPPVLAKQYFKKQAKARSIIPADVPALLPETSMKNLQLRMDAQVAKQRPLPGAKSSVEQNLVEQSFSRRARVADEQLGRPFAIGGFSCWLPGEARAHRQE